jgi:hypothetical protein
MLYFQGRIQTILQRVLGKDHGVLGDLSAPQALKIDLNLHAFDLEQAIFEQFECKSRRRREENHDFWL